MTILVTGGAGFIGSHVAEKLASQGSNVVIVDSFDPYYPREIKEANLDRIANDKINFIEADVTDEEYMDEIFRENEIRTVIHLAAKAGVRESVKDPAGYIRTNVLGTANLLEAARKNKAENFVFASSSSVYGNAAAPFRESGSTEPISPYGSSKKAAEVICESFSSVYGMNVKALRFFTVYGPRGRPDMAIPRFIGAIGSGRPVTLFDSGRVRRDFTFVSDVANAVAKSAETKHKKFEAINIGSDRPVDVRYIVSLIEQDLGKKAAIEHAPLPQADAAVTHADISKAEKILGWRPQVKIEDGIKKTVEWWRAEGKDLYQNR